jgi:hypothetical protein
MTFPWREGAATGVGSLPYDDPVEATRIVLGELPDLPHLPELPGRGPGADMIGRTCALLVELAVDLQPAGWRLTGAEGLDQRRSRSMLARDLDALEEVAGTHRGPLKVQATGPWTLAAGLERPRAGLVLGDHGARKDVAQSLAEGLAGHLVGVRRRVPGAELVVQLDEPSLPGILAGSVPTPSGFSRYRAVEEPEAVELLREVVQRVEDEGGCPVVHCCADRAPFGLLVRAGARALAFDLARVGETAMEPLAKAVDEGVGLFVGAVPSIRPPERRGANGTPGSTEAQVARSVLRLWRGLGFGEESAARSCVVSPACGLAGADPDWVRTALALSRKAAANLADRPED